MLENGLSFALRCLYPRHRTGDADGSLLPAKVENCGDMLIVSTADSFFKCFATFFLKIDLPANQSFS